MPSRADAEPILQTLRKAGFTPLLTGSVATKGHSEHDIDIKLFLALEDKEVQDMTDHPEYARYLRTMEKMGFQMTGGDETVIETWRRGPLVVDIFVLSLEDLVQSAAVVHQKQRYGAPGKRVRAKVKSAPGLGTVR